MYYSPSFILTIFLGIFIVNVRALENKKTESYDDLNTLNFIAKLGYMELAKIDKICSYDYCEYRTGSSFKSMINNFTKNYLKTIQDDEVRASLRIKGIKITEVVFVE